MLKAMNRRYRRVLVVGVKLYFGCRIRTVLERRQRTHDLRLTRYMTWLGRLWEMIERYLELVGVYVFFRYAMDRSWQQDKSPGVESIKKVLVGAALQLSSASLH